MPHKKLRVDSTPYPIARGGNVSGEAVGLAKQAGAGAKNMKKE